MQKEEFSPRRYTLHGRRKGKRLRTQKSQLVETLLPQLRIALADRILPTTLFPDKKTFWLEIGFGGGEHLAWQAQQNPAIGMLGAEPFLNGIASMVGYIHQNALQNIRIFDDDARLLLDALPDACISRCFVLFPDPWPKKRHADRRFIGPENLPKLARVMKPGAELRVASDDPTLQAWMKEHLQGSSDFQPTSNTENGVYKTRPADWPTTRYEQKELAKKRPNWTGPEYYCFVKR